MNQWPARKRKDQNETVEFQAMTTRKIPVVISEIERGAPGTLDLAVPCRFSYFFLIEPGVGPGRSRPPLKCLSIHGLNLRGISLANRDDHRPSNS